MMDMFSEKFSLDELAEMLLENLAKFLQENGKTDLMTLNA